MRKEIRQELVTRTRHDDLGNELETEAIYFTDGASGINYVLVVIEYSDIMSVESLESEILYDLADNSAVNDVIIPALREEIQEFAAKRYKEMLIERVKQEMDNLEDRQ